MINLIKELKRVLKQKNLSAEKASRYLNCSPRTIYRWFDEESVPSPIYKRLIRAGIAKIKEDYPEIKSTYNMALEAKVLWQQIRRKMTLEEKSELFDINFNKGTETYIAKLKELVEKYKK